MLLDFVDLESLIEANWKQLFKQRFAAAGYEKAQEMLGPLEIPKVNELRNLIAHPVKQTYRPFTEEDAALLKRVHDHVVRLESVTKTASRRSPP